MIDFFSWLKPDKSKSLKIFDDVYLKQGEILNIYGEPYVGKTLFTYYIINNNVNKSVMLFDTENSLYPMLEEISKKVPVIYSLINDLKNIKYMIWNFIDRIDYFIIDSITATDVVSDNIKQNILIDIIDIIEKNNKNLIMVSQNRQNTKGQMFYEDKKVLDFMSYKAEVKEVENGCIINNKYKINKNFLKGE
jgi:KaiC/GvpD/RAD55 family RecA-like ATPase